MSRINAFIAMGAMLALAACETTPGQVAEAYPLLDNTGTVLAYAPRSAAARVPPGTSYYMNINGRDTLVTLGPRASMRTSAGTPVILGTDDGRPIIGHVGEAFGDLASGGTPVVTGTHGRNNRPTIVYQQAGEPVPPPGTRR